LILSISAGPKWDGDGGVACGACDGVCREQKLHWTIVPGHCRRLSEEPIALEVQFVFQTQTTQMEPREGSESKYFSQDVSQGSEIPRGHIET
jgi:hypothetical protein